jgi:peroxiredoxin
MSIKVGDRIPDVRLKLVDEHGTEEVSTADVLGKGRVVLFGVPGAFTPTCSDHHLPGFVARSGELLGRGVDRIFCAAVNDAFVLAAWARSQGAFGKVAFLADANGELARAMGLELDLTKAGLGVRNKRYAALLQDGVVERLAVEEGTGVEGSSADAVASWLE